MKFWEIEQKYYELIDEETGEIKDEEAFDKLDAEETEKLARCIGWYKDMASDVDEFKKIEADCKKRRQALEKKMASLEYILNKHQQGRKFSCLEGEIKYTKSKTTECVDFDEFLKWDERFMYGTPTITPDKKKIKGAIDLGIEVPGFAIVEHNNMSIK